MKKINYFFKKLFSHYLTWLCLAVHTVIAASKDLTNFPHMINFILTVACLGTFICGYQANKMRTIQKN